MMRNIREHLFRVCPKTGKIVGFQSMKGQAAWLYPLIGLAALIWFVVRVVPKPSRANYPCQRMALPLASGFMVWTAGILAPALPFHQAQTKQFEKRWIHLAICVAIGAAALSGAAARAGTSDQASYIPHTPNAPIGVARGLNPGRVVWVHNSDVTDWAGPGSGQLWYEHVDQAKASEMMSWGLRDYANRGNDAAAWQAIFSAYNGGTGYQVGEKILIKINLTTSNAGGALADNNYNQLVKSGVTLDSTANSPQLLYALLDQLVNVVGVAQTDITIGDPTGLFVNYLYYPLHNTFPNVRYEDNRGGTGPEGEATRRARAEYTDPCIPYYWSTPDADGKTQDCAVQSFYEAKYIINFSVLKSHDRSGVTAAAKNHYGSMLRTPIGGGRTLGTNHYNLHDRLPLQPTNTAWQGMGYYRPLVDLMGNKYIGGKTVLYLIDGIFGGKGWNSVPTTWSMAPFNGDWPSSLFVSMDATAIDSVAFDFMSQKWPEYVLAYEGVQDFLHEAALANNPPSGTCYDPERDGICMDSLGVHEHWNNATEKQYSRNLGTGNGIELRYVTTDPGAYETYGIDLAVGWNLVSFNLHPLDSGIANVLASVAGNYSLVYAWDASGGHASSGNWMKYDPSAPGVTNTLTNLDEKVGFWIYMTAVDRLEVNGTRPATTGINLSTVAGGWNLAGYPGGTAGVLPDILRDHGVGNDFTLVYAYHAADTQDPWKLFESGYPFSDLTALTPGWGYWIYVTTDHYWEVAY